jgi:hypothetical protein
MAPQSVARSSLTSAELRQVTVPWRHAAMNCSGEGDCVARITEASLDLPGKTEGE